MVVVVLSPVGRGRKVCLKKLASQLASSGMSTLQLSARPPAWEDRHAVALPELAC